jgi:hypothetical protein
MVFGCAMQFTGIKLVEELFQVRIISDVRIIGVG